MKSAAVCINFTFSHNKSVTRGNVKKGKWVRRRWIVQSTVYWSAGTDKTDPYFPVKYGTNIKRQDVVDGVMITLV